MLHEETPMDCGYAACVEDSGQSLPEHHDTLICVGRWQPDLVLVSNSLKRIQAGSLPYYL